MFRIRLFTLVFALAMLTVATLIIQTGSATSAVVASGRDLSDYALRHPGPINTDYAAGASDWFERHPSNLAGASDWFQRHPESIAGNVVDRSDYFLRHPELLNLGSTADVSDWYQRHRSAIK